MLFRVLSMPLAMLVSCAVAPPAAAPMPPPALSSAPAEADRRAILAMLGNYEVRFDFRETVVLAPAYQRHETKTTGAHETVVLVADEGRRISLQHLLVAGGHVIKHWRQDWEYEAAQRLEFTEDQTWRLRTLPAARTRGAWTQCVYEVSDAPRYCGTARWVHDGSVATWTSDPTWRPLPRREYTVRDDYNAIAAINRHSVVPGGWTHEQDNSKVRRAGERIEQVLVREVGFNDYRRDAGFDFRPAVDYWTATGAYWARVRELWQARIAADQGVHLKTPVDGMALIEPLFTQADAVIDGRTVGDAEIRAVFDQWVAAP